MLAFLVHEIYLGVNRAWFLYRNSGNEKVQQFILVLNGSLSNQEEGLPMKTI